MLRLLPDLVFGGLFPGSSWLAAGRGRAGVDGASHAGGSGLLAELEAMLSQLPPAGRRQRRLHLVVSDGAAALATLPWQDKLKGQEELDAYARACFERNGRDLDDTWAMQTAFKQFGGGGLAYALPQAWLRDLLAVCDKFQVRLESVLPVSAAAYWSTTCARAGAATLLVLSEPRRVTGLVYEAGRLVLSDVQPIIGGMDASGRRLLLRLSARHPDIGTVRHWMAARETALPPFVAACLPSARASQLAREEWHR